MSIEELKKRKEKLNKSTENASDKMDKIIRESSRVSGIASNAQEILNDLDKQFEKETALDKFDVNFLFLTIMLQTIRWVLSPKLKMTQLENLSLEISKEDRLGAKEKQHVGGLYDGKSSGALYEAKALSKYREQHKDKALDSQEAFYKRENEYRSWIEILTQPVPYDALNGLDKKSIPNIAGLNKQNSNGTYNNIYGKNHHVATLGHDPILGWIFGTLNIMTSTITFVDFSSYQVVRGHKIKALDVFIENRELQFSDQAIDYKNPKDMMDILQNCILSIKEDYKRIMAAVVRQSIHLTSDKYCVEGLPIPVLSVIDQKKSQELIEKGWNSIEIERLLKSDLKQISISALVAMMINIIVEIIYMLIIDSAESTEIKEVKIRKIIKIANVITSSSNVLHAALSKNVSKLDIGGIGATLLTIFTGDKFIANIKQEFIKEKYSQLIMNNE
ncbi:MAG: hypothetical protein IJZ53_08440 [Tyzzerella sp.]|nr:hypothetical protein [Tyzzerella sp.]